VNDRLRVTLRSTLSDVARLGRAVEEFTAKHGLPAATCVAVNLALEEVVTNVVVHGYQCRDDQTISVELSLLPGVLVMSVEDGAVPFNPLGVPEPDLAVSLDQRQPGGLGMHLVRQMTDRLEYEHRDGKNRLVMTKNLIVVEQLDGRIDTGTAELVKQRLVDLVADRPIHLVVDFSQVTYISSIGLRALVIAAKRAASVQGKLVLCAIPDPVRPVFELAGLASVIPIYATQEAAMAALA